MSTMKKKSKIPYIRKQQHYKYVESCAVEQRERIIKSAILFGKVDSVSRELFMKYSEYLIKIKQK
jgi:hypothetical protein